MEKDFKIGCLEIENEKLKDRINRLKQNIRKISSSYQKRINYMLGVRTRAMARHNKRKEQCIHDHKEISDLKRTLYKLHPELKDAYNGYAVESRKRDKNQCIFCHRNVFEVCPDRLTHHIIPKGIGGTNELDNLATVCGDCHDVVEDFNYKLMSHINSQSKPKTK